MPDRAGMTEAQERRLPTAGEVRGILPKPPRRRFKVLVCGSRYWADYPAILDRVESLQNTHASLLVIEGGADGADRMAKHACRELTVSYVEVPALWMGHGSRAGPIRNRVMLDLEPDLVLAFPLPDSKGTWDCVREAQRRGIEVVIHGR